MCIKQADVIIYDRLVNPKILEWALPDCLLINVGKTRASIVYRRMKSMHCLSSMPKRTIILCVWKAAIRMFWTWGWRSWRSRRDGHPVWSGAGYQLNHWRPDLCRDSGNTPRFRLGISRGNRSYAGGQPTAGLASAGQTEWYAGYRHGYRQSGVYLWGIIDGWKISRYACSANYVRHPG